FVSAPLAVNKETDERQLIRTAMILEKYLDRNFRRRRAKAVELRQPFFTRCHLSPINSLQNPDVAHPGSRSVPRITSPQAQAMNTVRVWYLWRCAPAPCKLA